LLLECGLPWKEIQRKLNFETSKLDGCLVSHGHNDHSKALADVLRAGLDVYASRETFEAKGAYDHHNAKNIHETLARDLFSVAHPCIEYYWDVRPFDVVHDIDGAIGFTVEDAENDRLLFLTDTAYCKYTFPACNIIMIEANFSESILQRNVDSGFIDPAHAKRVRENHMSIGRVLDFLKANDLSRCREIRLIHLSDGNSNADGFKRMVQEATGIPTFIEGS